MAIAPPQSTVHAPGAPGVTPTWSPGQKDAVTTAIGSSRVWATVGHGIVNEVYWPSAGDPQTRDLGFIVAGNGTWQEVKLLPSWTISTPEPDVPVPTVVHRTGDWTLTFELVPDPERDVLLIGWQLQGPGVTLYPLLAPHLEVHRDLDPADQGVVGFDNQAWVADDGSLMAARDAVALCLAAAPGFRRTSVGYVGTSDGWQDFARNGAMTWSYASAGPGNVALMGELDSAAGSLALAFSADPDGAHTLALEALGAGIDSVRSACTAGWKGWASGLTLPAARAGDPPGLADAVRRSAAVIKVHEDHSYPGAFVASLSVPWGASRSDLSGYHLVWPRDATESGLALLALGSDADASKLLDFLISAQQADGHWGQNFFPDGTSFWGGRQLDETALPVMLAAKLIEDGQAVPPASDATVRRALAYLVENGPLTDQDRWEENSGDSPFTLGMLVCALVAGAQFLSRPGGGEPLTAAESDYVLTLADNWNERIEMWTYVTGSALDGRYGVAGHYIRIGPPPSTDPTVPWGPRGFVALKNQPEGAPEIAAAALVGMEFLYLVRLGLRAAGDPRQTDTIKVAEGELGQDVATGRAYHRYERDGYGETAGGGPYTGSGIGRLWPLLAGERGHYEAVAGNDSSPYLKSLLEMAGTGGLIPEQVWDTADIAGAELTEGHPTGSAMPLVWAHAELIKLAFTRDSGRPVEQLSALLARYPEAAVPTGGPWYWRESTDLTAPDGSGFDVIPSGRELIVEDGQSFTLHWGHDGWHDITDTDATPIAFGRYGVRLSAEQLANYTTLQFTRRYASGWEGSNHTVAIVAGAPASRTELEGHLA